MTYFGHILVLLGLLVLLPGLSDQQHFRAPSSYSPSFNSDCKFMGKPKKCIPDFVNAAYNLKVETTNTCGEEEDTPFCIQTGARAHESCGVCREGDHPASFLTDLNSPRNQTWWQSSTMEQGVNYPNQVNLTLHFKKAYDITFVRIWFYSPRPESFAIYKRTREDGPWLPFQFYSGSCRDMYGLEDRAHALQGEVTSALCTSEYSDISPLTGGNIAFSTLEGRNITAQSFESSAALQEWVTATDIRIVLSRMNTFGDEIFGGPTVLMSYFYAITDIAVGARCKCNGHAKECVDDHESGRKVCKCEHNTAGQNCETCQEFYFDAPWKRATDSDAQECKRCNCNGFSNRCYFDTELYEKTGHGGHCLDCVGFRDGANCERCKENFYLHPLAPVNESCRPCYCNEIGSRSLQCNSEGKCLCKEGVTGDKCDKCMDNYYDLSQSGCKPCDCLPEGSLDNQPQCDSVTGVCDCKLNVEGKQCKRCKLGYFNLDEENEFGCTPCFCYGHSSVCTQASGYSKFILENIFARREDKWTGQDDHGRQINITYDSPTQSISITAPGRDAVYFVAPDKFLGDQRPSYNQMLEFKLRIGEATPSPRGNDIIMEGAGFTVTQTIFGQGNPIPRPDNQEYRFRLHEHPNHGWEPRLTAKDFMSLLANLTTIKIRGGYTPRGIGFLDDVRLSTAKRGAAGAAANWIEMCSCPEGYIGQFCESCDSGFRHNPPRGGPFSQCIPCDCNGHADGCDADTGQCICMHNTAGDNCERCARGFYGNALDKTPHDCQVCPCPEGGPCMEISSGTVVCLDCPKGYAGARCDLCSDGYFGDLTGSAGSVKLCQACDCNNNIDPNAVGNCNRTTGECLKCIYNTAGAHCEKCLPGYFGDALADTPGDCKPCMCNPDGTEETADGPLGCNQRTGQCSCKPNVTGPHCDQCLPGYFNIKSGKGCELCQCSPTGSLNDTCDLVSGQCHCRPGVTGTRCDSCEKYHYGFSKEGCKPCECDDLGSKTQQCEPSNGQCPCLDNVEGRQCDRCKENKHDRQRGCVDCDLCYTLVQDAVNKHRANLLALDTLLTNITDNPTVVDNDEFDQRLEKVQSGVDQLWLDATRATGDDSKMTLKLESLGMKLNELTETLDKIDDDMVLTANITDSAEEKVANLDTIIENAKEDLKDALDFILEEGDLALKKAKNHSAYYGQQNQQMSDIAHQARTTAQKQSEEAKETQNIAEQALNISSQANELAKEAIEKQVNATKALQKLNNDMQLIKEKLNQTKYLAESSQRDASAANNESLEISSEIRALSLPSIKSDSIKAAATTAHNDGERLHKEGLRIRDMFNKERDEIMKELEESNNTLNDGLAKQNELDHMFSEIDKINDIAQKAVANGEKTLKDTKAVYESIDNFDQQVQERKKKAEEALKDIPKIETLLMEADEKLKNSQSTLDDADRYAKKASKTVNDLSNLAHPAAQKSDGLKKSANETKIRAVQLYDEAEKLNNDVLETSTLFDNKQKQSKAYIDTTADAMKKVAKAEKTVTDAADKIKSAFKAVEEIKEHLKSDIGEIDDSNLELLERRLMKAENDLNNTNFTEYMDNLTKARRDQAQLVKSYKDELEKLKLDVQNIEDIARSLPESCLNRLKLEAP